VALGLVDGAIAVLVGGEHVVEGIPTDSGGSTFWSSTLPTQRPES
jgi:hypothetical protein